MSPTHAFASAVMSAMILAGLASTARTQPLNTVVEVECDAFRKNPDGSWTLSRTTEVKQGIFGLLLEPATIRKNDKNVFGFDLTRVLEQNCVQPANKK